MNTKYNVLDVVSAGVQNRSRITAIEITSDETLYYLNNGTVVPESLLTPVEQPPPFVIGDVGRSDSLRFKVVAIWGTTVFCTKEFETRAWAFQHADLTLDYGYTQG